MNTTTRAARALRNMEDGDAAKVLDDLALALRTGMVHPIGAGCYTATVSSGRKRYTATIAQRRDGETVLIGLSRARGRDP